MPNVVLSSAIRSNLLQLQNIGRDQGVIQNRLATGLKVSSALDDPQNFFQAQGLNNRANDLARLQDSMRIGVRTLEAADKGIKAMTKITETMMGLARQARDLADDDTDGRNRLAAQFEALREQLINQAEDANYNGTNLLNGDELQIIFNTELDLDNANKLVINEAGTGTNDLLVNLAGSGGILTATGSGTLSAVIANVSFISSGTGTAAVSGNANIDAAINGLQGFLNDLRSSAAVLGTNLSIVRVREDFTKEMINTLKGGADDLTLADQNEEAANLLALNTRQQLSQQALALASQSEQSILRLLS